MIPEGPGPARAPVSDGHPRRRSAITHASAAEHARSDRLKKIEDGRGRVLRALFVIVVSIARLAEKDDDAERNGDAP